MTKQPHLVVVLTEAEKRDQLIREALQSEPISKYPDFIAAVGAALDDLDRFRSERSFIVGCNEGFEAAIDQAARLIEEYSIMDTSGGKELSHRIDGNREGLHYAISIRALVAGNKAPAPTTTANLLPSADDIDDLIERLLDAQQDINLSANETMNQQLCDASALIDEVEKMLRLVRDLPPATQADTTVRDGISAALIAMKLAASLPGVSKEYDFADAIAATEAAWLKVKDGNHPPAPRAEGDE